MSRGTIRVLHAIPKLDAGDVERQLLSLGRMLARQGIGQSIVSMTSGGTLRDEYVAGLISDCAV